MTSERVKRLQRFDKSTRNAVDTNKLEKSIRLISIKKEIEKTEKEIVDLSTNYLLTPDDTSHEVKIWQLKKQLEQLNNSYIYLSKNK